MCSSVSTEEELNSCASRRRWLAQRSFRSYYRNRMSSKALLSIFRRDKGWEVVSAFPRQSSVNFRRQWTIMAVLGHRTPNMSITYARLCPIRPSKQQYQDALDRHLGPDVTLAGPAAEALREHRPRPRGSVLAANQLPQDRTRTRPLLALPQPKSPCECDFVLTLLEIPHDQRLLTAPPRPSRRRTATHRRRHRPRLAA